MKFNWLRNTSLTLALAASLGFTACDDDKDDIEINTQEQWLGAACECIGSTEHPCVLMKVPTPSGSPISGCDNVPEIDGALRICLRTISEDFKIFAPPTYFPQGYCALGAIKCENSNLCSMASYGDVDKFTSCPKGSAMLTSSFEYTLAGLDEAQLTSKTCAKLCKSDDDCNKDGEMSCIEVDNVKFCYNDKNFVHTPKPSVTVF